MNDKQHLSSEDWLDYIRQNAGNVPLEKIKEAIKELNSIRQDIQKREEEERERAEKKARRERELERKRKETEHIEAVTSMELPTDFENVFNNDTRAQGIHTDSIPDGLIMSLNTLGRVDIEYISSVTGQDYKTVITALKGSIYQNPETWGECFYKGWETSDEYLSGNLMRKYAAAKEADKKYRGYFADNVAAITRVLPPSVASEDIYITLGSPWVPEDIINDFVTHILDTPQCPYTGTVHDELTGTWELWDKSAYFNNLRVTNLYGTSRINALHIIERTLNMKTVAVKDTVPCATNKSGKRQEINKSETLLAIEKQQKLIKEFQKWVWKDPERKKRLETIFENNFSCVRRRIFDGSFLTFPTMSKNITLYPYQKDAVARIIFTPNTLLAHDVGAGKTYVMIAAGMELLRMGLSKKNMYVVPNNIVGQWKSIFEEMYPNANILCVEPKIFTSSKREKTLEKIRDGSYDAIIIAYSCFSRIPISREYYIKDMEEKKKAIEEALNDRATIGLRSKRKKIEKALAELIVAAEECSICFDELGVTRLFVDEAHNFKNITIDTQVDKVLGINRAGSQKCNDMLHKVHIVQKQNNGGGVVLATGTPITNSITDAYIMQQYLQSGELAMLDLGNFDSWIGMFAERVTEFEIDVDTSSYRLATRFAKFHNLPELTGLLSSIADFHDVDESGMLPDFDGYTDSLIAKTSAFSDYLELISHRADDVRKGLVNPADDNMLKITTDGRKAALDLRLVQPAAPFSFQSKIARCAENVADIYYKTNLQKSAQLVFCDTSTPKNDFNMYDELKRLLTAFGIKEEEIAYIHDASSERQRASMFARVRKGDIRVLIGSTFKLGLGVNVQDKLIALHHLDVPWRPADMTQREGRILRQGNTNKKVIIFRYITEGSFDAYSWQLLETKQRFITALLSGTMTDRSGSDVDDTVLDYAEVKALAVGNPLVKERVETYNELTRYRTLQKKLVDMRIALGKELNDIPSKIAYQNSLIEKCAADIAFYEKNKREYKKEERRIIRKRIFDAVRENSFATAETELMNYQGFTVVLPANMSAEKPYVWLVREGRYYTEIGDSEIGALIRVDNCLGELKEHLNELNNGLDKLTDRERSIAAQLAKEDSYQGKIEECKARLDKIDKKLGVDKK